MHPKEAKKIRNGTGRLAQKALSNSEMFIGLDFSRHSGIQALLDDHRYTPFILYPGKTSKNIEDYEPDQLIKQKKTPLVFVIDGTWKGAKKMMALSRNLHSLPRIFINPKEPSRFIIKQQPNTLCLSTIESIFCLLDELDKMGIENLEGRHMHLQNILDKIVDIQLTYIHDNSIQGYRKIDGKSPREKVFSKKPHKVSPFYK